MGQTAPSTSRVRLQPPHRVSLSQLVLDQLLAQIRDGALRAGDRLPSEHELTRMLNVGRSSVREALRGLITLGLVETRPGRGAVVVAAPARPLGRLEPPRRSIDDLQKSALLDLLEVREGLEGEAARLAAERASAVDLASIERHALECERRLLAGRSAVRANIEFHVAIARASHNNLLASAVRHLIGQVREYRERMAREVLGISDRDLTEHRLILEALGARSAEQARQAVVSHIRGFAERVRKLRDPGEAGPG